MTAADWQPGASIETLKARERLVQLLRAFFNTRGYLEVDTPTLASATVTDPNIDSIAAGEYWLQTSPEFAMKRLLAAGSGPIFQFAHAFRAGEAGRWHNPEFTLLEWYVPGFDHIALMAEVEQLMRRVTESARPDLQWECSFPRVSYQDCFQAQLKINPFTASLEDLQSCAQSQGQHLIGELDRDGWLDLLMGECIGPKLGLDLPCFVMDYPPSQAALARIRDGQPAVASRFELYWQGLELANGFHELADASEQRARFQSDLERRVKLGKPLPAMDENLLAALESGLPDCAGVALGLDRLLALLLDKTSLSEVMAFPSGRI